MTEEGDGGIELLCDEDPFVSSGTPPPPPTPTRRGIRSCLSQNCQPLREDEERVRAFKYFLSREQQFAPHGECLKQLQCSPSLSSARFKAIHYIVSVRNRLSLAVGTVFNAANYVDRFLSVNCCMKWEDWMVELLSVACVSIASKFDEVNIPSLHDLQTEDMEHRFQSSTIRDMELTVLKALDWRVSCVTPFSYVDLLLPIPLPLPLPLLWRRTEARVTHLLLLCLQETTLLLQFGAFVVSASALRCVLQDDDDDDDDGDGDASFSDLTRLIPVEHMVKLEECYKIMKQIWVNNNKKKKKKSKEWSPVSVIRMTECADYS